MSSPDANADKPLLPEEAYTLGEHYNLGTPLTGFKVCYTRLDLLHFVLFSLFMSYLLIAGPVMILANTFFRGFYCAHMIIFMFVLISSFIINHKRDYRPIITPLARDLRVFVYHDGFIRRVRGKTNVVLWSQISRVRIRDFSGISGAKNNLWLSITYQTRQKMRFNANLQGLEIFATHVDYEYRKRQQSADLA